MLCSLGSAGSGPDKARRPLSLVYGLASLALALSAGRGSGQLRMAHPTVIPLQSHSFPAGACAHLSGFRTAHTWFQLPALLGAFGKVDDGCISPPCAPFPHISQLLT